MLCVVAFSPWTGLINMFKEMLFGNCSLAFFVAVAVASIAAATAIFGQVSFAWLHLLVASLGGQPEIWRRNEPLLSFL